MENAFSGGGGCIARSSVTASLFAIVRCELRLFFLAIVAWSALADSRYLYPKLNSKQIKEH
jgi:hypothetical protein